MKKKIDNVLYSLFEARVNIIDNTKDNANINFQQEVVDKLDNIIINYTISNKMETKEILDCALSMYGIKNNNNFLDKIYNLRPSKIIENSKSKIIKYRQKKKKKEKYEKDIVKMVKEKLKDVIEEEKKHNNKVKKESNEVNKNNNQNLFDIDFNDEIANCIYKRTLKNWIIYLENINEKDNIDYRAKIMQENFTQNLDGIEKELDILRNKFEVIDRSHKDYNLLDENWELTNWYKDYLQGLTSKEEMKSLLEDEELLNKEYYTV